ncbi:MAG TPA: dTDP-4-dehydrorhamnose 3,5-epimerase family protein [Bacteroidota bacterium]|nr:dTDP-4-dehydrorhamnose 3,5-epimerase family protein [Bacteroidota bacterium]
MFRNGKIHDVQIRDLTKYVDDRGWLAELYRLDEIDGVYTPAMTYLSATRPGIARGPHEHVDQSDMFAFIGPSNFKIYLWDNRKSSPSYGNKFIFLAGEDSPRSVIIPPGVVHAYKNVGTESGLVINMPNRLFAGKGRKEPVDEIRHEDKPDSLFKLD